MKIIAAALQMASEPWRVSENLERADHWLTQARRAGADLAVLPELFNTGYRCRADFSPYAEDVAGPTLTYLRARSRLGKMTIAAGFVEHDGPHLYDSVAVVTPDGGTFLYRKRNLVFWERSRFRPGRAPLIVATPFGRIGFAICADMIYQDVWRAYRDRVDLAVVSAAWPDFADRGSGRQHWLLGHVGPLAGAIPGRVAHDLGIPVIFANQCGRTQTQVPFLPWPIADQFAGKSSICDGRHGAPVVAGRDDELIVAAITLHPRQGLKSWRSTYRSVPAAFSSAPARS